MKFSELALEQGFPLSKPDLATLATTWPITGLNIKWPICHHPWRRSPGHLVSYWLYWIHFILENQWFLLPGIDTFQVWVCHSCLWGVSQHRYLGACGVFVGLVDWHRIQSNVMSNPLYSRRGALMGWRPWHSYFPKLTITWVLGLHSWSTNMEMVFYEHRVLSSRTQYTV